MSQEQIAEWLSCETRTIQRYEAGEQYPTQDRLLKMAECYHCKLDDLFPKAYNTSNTEKQIDHSSNSKPNSGGEIPLISPHLFWSVFLDLLSFRRPMPVAELLIYSDGSEYYNCPRCNHTIDREFMDFCNCCGQHLSWKDYKKAKKTYTGQQDFFHA